MDALNGVNSHEITLYEYDGRNLVTKEINALGDSTVYVYDGNGNLVSKTDADGYVTAVELHIDTDDVVNGTGTDVKEMLYYGYALPHEKKTMLAMTDEMLQNTENFTATLGSLTITQKVTFENCTVIGEGENRIYWPEEGKTGHYTMDLRIAEN